jgi:hypothetical protein
MDPMTIFLQCEEMCHLLLVTLVADTCAYIVALAHAIVNDP